MRQNTPWWEPDGTKLLTSWQPKGRKKSQHLGPRCILEIQALRHSFPPTGSYLLWFHHLYQWIKPVGKTPPGAAVSGNTLIPALDPSVLTVAVTKEGARPSQRCH